MRVSSVIFSKPISSRSRRNVFDGCLMAFARLVTLINSGRNIGMASGSASGSSSLPFSAFRRCFCSQRCADSSSHSSSGFSPREPPRARRRCCAFVDCRSSPCAPSSNLEVRFGFAGWPASLASRGCRGKVSFNGPKSRFLRLSLRWPPGLKVATLFSSSFQKISSEAADLVPTPESVLTRFFCFIWSHTEADDAAVTSVSTFRLLKAPHTGPDSLFELVFRAGAGALVDGGGFTGPKASHPGTGRLAAGFTKESGARLPGRDPCGGVDPELPCC